MNAPTPHAVRAHCQAQAWPEAAQALNRIRQRVALNLVLGALVKRVNVLLSFGGIVRETATLDEPSPPAGTQPPIRLQVAHELTFGAAVTARAHRTFGLGLEAVGTLPVAGEATQPTATALGSLFILPHEKLRLSLSGGGGLISSSARNAEGRVLIGMSYSLSPRLGGLL